MLSKAVLKYTDLLQPCFQNPWEAQISPVMSAFRWQWPQGCDTTEMQRTRAQAPERVALWLLWAGTWGQGDPTGYPQGHCHYISSWSKVTEFQKWSVFLLTKIQKGSLKDIYFHPLAEFTFLLTPELFIVRILLYAEKTTGKSQQETSTIFQILLLKVSNASHDSLLTRLTMN